MLSSLARRLVTKSHRRRGSVIAAAVLLAALCLVFTATQLGMNTDTDALFDRNLPFAKADDAFSKLFPADRDLVVVVIDAPSKMQAEAAADRLAAALSPRTDLYRSV